EEVCFALPGLLHSVTTVFHAQAGEKDIKLQLHVAENIPQLLMGDPTRLTQILINLIGNGLKFTRHGNIDVRAELKFESSTDVLVQFTVKDTGIGIPQEKLALIFERFTQAQAETTRLYGGTGLGLSIVKKLVELQRGTITVESTENSGSAFIFTIPYKKADSVNYTSQEEPERLELNKNEAHKILIVEDNLLNQRLASFILKDMGYKHFICGNGRLAIDELNKNKYDLILMDIQMPEMNGYDTTIYIREQMKLKIPVIAMTAHALPGEREKCISFGMTDYVSKPINDAQLSQMITNYLNKQRT
ncbi:MAG: response regulator, partial [Bacteroidetes bacterium]|nr:response regulator [Bacteroidota bacterium]